MSIAEIKRLIDACEEEHCHDVLKYVRKRVDIHPLETKLNCKAEIILEAIDRAADITIRGIRGIITEVTFKQQVLDNITTWTDITTVGEHAYDFLLEEVAVAKRKVNVQVKMQRKEKQVVKVLPGGEWVVEVQKTRNGEKAGKATRPYSFGEFDILAVSLQPGTGDWGKFRYTVGRWLLARPKDNTLIRIMQPVPIDITGNVYWTDNLEECIKWFFDGAVQTIPEAVKSVKPKKEKVKKEKIKKEPKTKKVKSVK
jgi:hypothetical protein